MFATAAGDTLLSFAQTGLGVRDLTFDAVVRKLQADPEATFDVPSWAPQIFQRCRNGEVSI